MISHLQPFVFSADELYSDEDIAMYKTDQNVLMTCAEISFHCTGNLLAVVTAPHQSPAGK